MLKITLYQMRRNIGRLIAAGIAIAIGTAFVAATFIGGDVLVKTAQAAVTANLAQGDLTANGSYKGSADGEWEFQEFTEQEVAKVAELPGVAEVNVTPEWVDLTLVNGDKSEYTGLAITAEHKNLQMVKVPEGKAPTTANEIAIPEKSFDRLGVKIGDTVTWHYLDWEAKESASEEGKSEDEATALATRTKDLTVTGKTDDYLGAYSSFGGASLLTLEGWEELYKIQNATDTFGAARLVVAAEQGTNIADLQAAMNEITGKRPTYTPAQVAENTFSSITGEANIIMTFVLVFAALALFVAGLVITNTFQVLVAQRARTLALLRCVGANKKQIRNSVLVEAGILGALASITGIIIGLVLMQATLSIIGQFDFARGLPQWISIPATSIWVPLLVGTLVTVLASLVPARVATKVSPLAALRPQEGAGEASKKMGRVRLAFALLLVLGGAALMGTSMALILADGDRAFELLLLAGICGGMLSFIGLIISSVVWVPKVVGWIGKLVSVGPASQLAAANTVRNPRRTAATATALFIGVTLVAMMSVGAATARESFNSMLDDQYPIDIQGQLGWSGTGETQITPEMLERVRSIDGVEAAALGTSIHSSAYMEPVDTGKGYQAGGDLDSPVLGISKEDARKVFRVAELAELYDDNSAIMPSYESSVLDGKTATFYAIDTSQISDDDSYELWDAPAPERPGFENGLEFKAVKSPATNWEWITTPAAVDKIAGLEASQSTSSLLLIKVKDVNNAGKVVDSLRDLFDEDSVYFTGAVMERLMFQQAIDIILLVLVGLLAVAVVIALIGVANTLSLSVIERRRESATLRAIGMSKKQLKRSLGIEGMLIAGIGALLGISLGILYAYIGSTLLLGGFSDVKLSIRWQELALILVISLVAGLLASVMPARGAANTSPVEALAMD